MSIELKSSNILSGKSFFNQHFRLFKHVDFTLIFLVIGLCILGLLVVYSTTHQENINEGVMQTTRRQLIYILTGLFFCFLVTVIDYHDIAKIAVPLFFLSLIMLLYVIFFGKNIGGSRRWIQLAGYEFQPAEFAKITLIIFLADFLNKQKGKIPNFLYFSLPFLFTGILMLLICKQPDLGTAIVFFAIALIMIFIAGISWKYIITVFVILLSLFPIVWTFLKDYQKSRLLLFLNPEMDPLGAGYNIIQS